MHAHMYECNTAYVFVLPSPVEVTVSFARPSYTFTENGVVGSIEVVKTGVSSAPFDVRVTGGGSAASEPCTLHFALSILTAYTSGT